MRHYFQADSGRTEPAAATVEEDSRRAMWLSSSPYNRLLPSLGRLRERRGSPLSLVGAVVPRCEHSFSHADNVSALLFSLKRQGVSLLEPQM